MTNIFRSLWVLVVLLAAVLVFLGGCKDEENPVQVTPDPIVEPDTPQALMSRLRAGYETRDKTDYLSLLDPDFLFLLQQETTARYPELGPSLDFAEEERIHTRMFSGQGVVDPLGDLWPAVLNVGFLAFRAMNVWADTDGSLQFPDTQWALFEVDLLIDCGPSFSTYKATGQVKIYVREYSRMQGTEEITYYKLAGMVDLTQSDKSTERTSWGLIKAFYR